MNEFKQQTNRYTKKFHHRSNLAYQPAFWGKIITLVVGYHLFSYLDIPLTYFPHVTAWWLDNPTKKIGFFFLNKSRNLQLTLFIIHSMAHVSIMQMFRILISLKCIKRTRCDVTNESFNRFEKFVFSRHFHFILKVSQFFKRKN